MLIEMWSPVFKKHGEIREPIRFHHGLNVIMGMDLADNSIGKSSSLLAIDFIFGGNSYLKSIAVKKLGDHPIYETQQSQISSHIVTMIILQLVKQCPWKSFWTNLRKGII